MNDKTLKFYQDEIRSTERQSHPFVGYISPEGRLINFRSQIGMSSHDCWRNPVGEVFLSFISYITGEKIEDKEYYKKFMPDAYAMMKVDGYEEAVYRGYDQTNFLCFKNFDQITKSIDYLIKKNKNNYYDKMRNAEYHRFVIDLLYFFRNVYKNKDFFKAIDRVIKIEEYKVIKTKLERRYPKDDYYFDSYGDSLTQKEQMNQLMSYFKDICVMFLGYDSVETYMPNGMSLAFENLKKHYYPRIITTSYLNIYERFWNYHLMNWSIHQLPRYTYDEKTGIYTKQSELMDFHVSDREMELKEELEKIKAKTSLDERYIYLK